MSVSCSSLLTACNSNLGTCSSNLNTCNQNVVKLIADNDDLDTKLTAALAQSDKYYWSATCQACVTSQWHLCIAKGHQWPLCREEMHKLFLKCSADKSCSSYALQMTEYMADRQIVFTE